MRFDRHRLVNGCYALLWFPWIVWASLRLSWWYPRRRLDQLTNIMSDVFVSPTVWPRQPERLRSVVHFVRPVLPPFGMGACLKSSLILLDIMARARVPVTFHLGVASDHQDRAFHAWVESKALKTERLPLQYRELWCWSRS
ncbi:MAG: lasso peptide biosynthesis B2 protein [Acidobacteria bacterium]|nr:lasso peptide biosynthesis B2 protein [Acidobacteriota bacterium]